MRWMLFGLLLGVAASAAAEPLERALVKLEQTHAARIGVALVDEQGRLLAGYRTQQGFALCSTFKLPLAALVLESIAQGRLSADQPLSYSRDELQEYAPVAKRYVATGYLTVNEANWAALQLSDNSAANLLLQALGGPKALTEYFRRLGDERSRLDRYEPELNANQPNDPRDSTTPQAMAQVAAKVLLANALPEASRRALQRALIGSPTGEHSIRAGLPEHWQVGGKTGSCSRGARNEVAFWQTERGVARVLSIYIEAPKLSTAQRDALLAQIARLVAGLEQ